MPQGLTSRFSAWPCSGSIDALNLTVVRQQQELDTLRRQFDELVRLLRAQSSPQDGSERWHARDDIPPHY